MQLKQMSHLNQRLIVGGSVLLVSLCAILFSQTDGGQLLFTTLLAVIAGVSIWELLHMAEGKGFHPFKLLPISSGAAAVFAASYLGEAEAVAEIIFGIALFLLFSSFIFFFCKGQEPLTNISLSLFSFIYIAIPLCCIALITHFFPLEGGQDNRWWLFYLLAVTKMTDICAYFFGTFFGKHRLASEISPKKSWEGAIAGLLCSLVTSISFSLAGTHFSSSFYLTLPDSIILGVFLSIFGQIGDLAESLLKRDLKVKDSNCLPGLGGFLDAIDSFTFTSPLLYLFLILTNSIRVIP